MLNKNIQQGGIFLADLNPAKGHEQSGYRPVIVLQNDILNRNLNTVVIAPITKNLIAKGFLTTYFLDKKHSKLKFDSLVLLFQMRTLDKKRLKKYIAKLDQTKIREIKRQMNFLF